MAITSSGGGGWWVGMMESSAGKLNGNRVVDGWMAAIPSLWRGLIMSFEKINFQLIGNDDGTGRDGTRSHQQQMDS